MSAALLVPRLSIADVKEQRLRQPAKVRSCQGVQNVRHLQTISLLSCVVVLNPCLIGAEQRTVKSNMRNPKNLSVVKMAEVRGRAFLITGNGDLKPARMAEVDLLPSLEERSPGKQFFRKALAAVAYEARTGISIVEGCRLFAAYRGALADTLEETDGTEWKERIIREQTDEEGYFRIQEVPVGDYVIVITGQAGSYDAMWHRSLHLSPGRTEPLKFPNPSWNCSKLE